MHIKHVIVNNTSCDYVRYRLMSNNLRLKYSGLYCSVILGYVPPVTASVLRWTTDH